MTQQFGFDIAEKNTFSELMRNISNKNKLQTHNMEISVLCLFACL